MKPRILLSAIMALCAATAMPQAATKLTASKANDFGVAYTLPNTVVDVVIESEYTLSEPGEFSNYANLYLNRTDAVTAPERTATVKSVTLVPRGVPNPENRWLVDFKGGIVYMMLDQADAPLAINTEDVAPAILPAIPSAVPAAPTALEAEAAHHAVTQEMSQATSLSKRAWLASQRIYELRQMRSDLISGQAENTPPDGLSMQLALDNLAAQEAALTAMFVGTKKTWTAVNTVTFTPGEENVTDLVIARLSPTAGVVDASDLSGEPIYLSMKVLTTGELPTDASGAPKKAPKGGVAYNIPGTVHITVSFGAGDMAQADVEVAQIGKQFYLDPKIFTDKKAPAFVIFNPVTGGISTIGTR